MTSTLLYCHGQPGGPGELGLFGPLDLTPETAITAPDRNHATAALPTGELTLIGFSLGAKVALEVAAAHPERIAHIHLIAPAGPVNDDAMFSAMAGGALFRMARDRPRMFAATARLQSLSAGIAPGLLTRALLASAQGEDATLARDPAFGARMATMLKTGLGRSSHAYAQEISAYVQPWSDLPPRVSAPVTLWLGESDNWVPPAVVEALAEVLPNVVALHRLPGLSHYSTLRHAMHQIATT
jgi:pimeloyl-ACP methyl ester carboxylesterase